MNTHDTVRLVDAKAKRGGGYLDHVAVGDVFVITGMSGTVLSVKRDGDNYQANLSASRFKRIKIYDKIDPTSVNDRFIQLVETYGIQRVSYCTGLDYEQLGKRLNYSISPGRCIGILSLEVSEYRCRDTNWNHSKWENGDVRREAFRALIDDYGVKLIIAASGYQGEGALEEYDCNDCSGTGKVGVACDGVWQEGCIACSGTGRVNGPISGECKRCSGTGFLTEGEMCPYCDSDGIDYSGLLDPTT